MTETAKDMGKLIRHLREQAGYSRDEFAAAFGVSRNTLINLERGWTTRPDKPITPHLRIVSKVSDALEIDLNRMLTAYGMPVEDVAPRFIQLDTEELSPEDIARARGYIDGLKRKERP